VARYVLRVPGERGTLTARYERVDILLRLGRLADAVALAGGYLAESPDDPELARLLAVALDETGQHDQAAAVAERALALQPDRAEAHRTLGWVRHHQGRGHDAAGLLARALSLAPDDDAGHLMRGEVLVRLATGPGPTRPVRDRWIAEAEAHAGEALRLQPDEPGAALLHAKLRVVAGDAAGTEWWARRALALAPDHEVGHSLLGLAARLRGDRRAAADRFVAAGSAALDSDVPLTLLRDAHRRGVVKTSVAVGLPTLGAAGLAAVVGGPALALVPPVVVVAAVVIRWRIRRSLSDRARRVLALDRELQPRAPGLSGDV
jgi:tetratricopeptide (TPR) repeat protein